MTPFAKLLGNPWIFEHVRPWVVGGIDMSPAYDRLQVDGGSRVLDVGCGTGDALRYLSGFESYLGVDTDARAIETAKIRWTANSRVDFECRRLEANELDTRRITHVALVGLLHHLDNAQAIEVLGELSRASQLVRAVSLDVVYLPGYWLNNALAFMDRGRFARTTAGYEALARQAKLRIQWSEIVRCHPSGGRVHYFVMEMTHS
ncbi:MAG TPA: class I SAM-dependent methyltransferase [Polyangiaceae bacterium]|jgi:SAM-dependent methyltransferase|nr:class I SAM-dependent methyltransferase [Polyangiaceae bacterium]